MISYNAKDWFTFIFKIHKTETMQRLLPLLLGVGVYAGSWAYIENIFFADNKTIGLFNTKAENVIKTCRILVEQHGGEVPENREALEALPGVGRKTANVVLNTAFRWPTIAVDTHIFRVSNRTKLAPGKNVDEVEQKLLKVVPSEFKLDVHHWLILHGRYTCVARKPKCGSCIIEDLCEYSPPKEK